MLPNTIQQQFKERYTSNPLIIRSPGRVNLIGEHTDYNEGFVLPAAIDKAIYLAFAKNHRKECRVFSLDFGEEKSFTLDNMQPGKGWINFVLGVTAKIKAAGHQVEGFDCVFGGDIPIGAGLSSSAALENGVGLGLSELFGLGLDRLEMVKLSQLAEHEYAGVNCGIMDMFASMMGKKDHAIRLDCRSLDYVYFPVALGNYQLLLCDTQVSHSLADSAYNTRREECQQGVEKIKELYPDVKNLRDVDLSMLDEVRNGLPEKVFERCAYVVKENERVIKSCHALENNDLPAFGALMYGSHEGLSKDYEVSCRELDFLVEKTRKMSFVLGARMMGGGFGGCTINLLAKEHKAAFIQDMSHAYQKEFGKDVKVYEVNIEAGTGTFEVR